MTRKEILSTALKCVNGERDQQYGNPENNFRLIADFWNLYLNKCGASHTEVYIRPKDVAAMMSLMKLARITTGQPKADNWIDLAGYAACGGEVEPSENSDEMDDCEDYCEVK